jgi:hypothetical protein
LLGREPPWQFARMTATTNVQVAGDKRQHLRRLALAAACWSGVAVLFAVLALANPTNGDEDLFVAPAAVPASARIYVDFLFLHMPLQAELTRLFASLFPGYGFIALRLAMGLLGAALLGLVYVAQRGLGVERRNSIICTVLLACTYSFQFSSGVVRNDIMAALLSTAGTAVALAALRSRPWGAAAWCAAGLLFSAAAAVRLSAAFPAAGAGLFLLAESMRGRMRPQVVATFSAGAIVGLLPCLQAWRAAPDAFIYSVLTYPSTGNLEWYLMSGRQVLLNPAANVVITLGVLAVGPGLGAALGAARARQRREAIAVRLRPDALLLDFLIVAGLIGALLPMPSNFQEAMTFLPQLFIRLGLELPGLLASGNRIDRLAVRLLVFGAVVGCGYGLFVVTRRGDTTWPAIAVTKQAHWIGDRLLAAGGKGFISTFASRVVLDSGYALDPRFSSGQFLYRTAALLSIDELNSLHGIGPKNLMQALDKNAPVAIVVGGLAMEQQLRGYAEAHHYSRETSPSGRYDLYIRGPR